MESSLEKSKEALRCRMSTRRSRQARWLANWKSARAARRLMRLSVWNKAGVVLFYCSVGGELMTHRLFKAARREGKVAAFPRMEGNRAVFVRADSRGDLRPSRYGIPEPFRGKAVNPKSADLILVPGTAFSLSGERLGRGGGHYDHILAGTGAVVAGLGFEFQVVPSLPSGSRDMPLDLLVTESAVRIFGSRRRHG